MKITEIEIKLVPSMPEAKEEVRLVRGADKTWRAVEGTQTLARGLYPSEVELAFLIQNNVINVWKG